MLFYVWVDDTRPIPKVPYENCYWAKTYKEAISFIKDNIRPADSLVVDLDHDLGSKKSGYDIAKWLVQNGYQGSFRVHSMNPVGAKNIRDTLLRYGWQEINLLFS